MDVSDHSALKNKLVESLISRDSAVFKKYLQESISHVENMLVSKYSKEIKESLNA